jgi:hypothetical protein
LTVVSQIKQMDGKALSAKISPNGQPVIRHTKKAMENNNRLPMAYLAGK